MARIAYTVEFFSKVRIKKVINGNRVGGMFVQMRLKGGERKKKAAFKMYKNFGRHGKEKPFVMMNTGGKAEETI